MKRFPGRAGGAASAALGPALFLFLVTGCATSPEPPAVDAGLSPVVSYSDTYSRETAEELREGGMGVVVVADGKAALVDGYGYADDASGTPIEPDTVFRFGSITKLFTAIGVMQLVEQGRVDLDEPFTTYVPEFTIKTRGEYAPFTVRDLLTHHAGLPANVSKGWAAGSAEASGWETRYREIIEVLRNEYAAAPPRTAFAYSNTGFMLLGILIERVSGADYADYIAEHILEPLGMDSAGFLPGEGGYDRLATGYPAGNTPADAFTYIRDIPAGSLFASLEDMARFLEMLVAEGALPNGDGRILEADTFARMGEPQNADVPADLDFRIGLAFWLVNPTPVPDAGLMSHGGDIAPFHAVMTTAPGADAAVLAVVNSDQGADVVTGTAIEMMHRLLEERRGRRFEETPLPERQEVPLDEAALAGLEGYWAGPIGLIEGDGRRGRIRLDTFAGTLTGVHRGDGALSLEIRVLGIPVVDVYPLFGRLHDLDGQPVLGFYQNGILMGYAHRHEPEPVPESWQNRAGTYEITNPDPVNAIENPAIAYDGETGLLTFEYYSTGFGARIAVPLVVENESLAVAAGTGSVAGEALQVHKEGGHERVHYSGLEMRKVE